MIEREEEEEGVYFGKGEGRKGGVRVWMGDR